MIELVQANWWLFIIALLIGIAVAWLIFAATRKTRVDRSARSDVLDEGAERAKRNQALIDSPALQPENILANPLDPATVVAAGGQESAMVEPELAADPEPATKPSAEPAGTQAPPSARDDLKRIKGVGPKLEKMLNALGVTSFAQIAEWDEADIDRIDPQLGNFQGRIRRDSWVEQAKFLASGDMTAFQAKFGNV